MRGAMQRFGKGKGAFPGDLRDLPELSAGTMPGEKKVGKREHLRSQNGSLTQAATGPQSPQVTTEALHQPQKASPLGSSSMDRRGAMISS